MKAVTIGTALATIAAFCALATTASAAPKLLDAGFAKTVCDGWNKTSLPKEVGRSGSGWIDSADSRGLQTIVVTRSDCSGWKPVQLVIKADDAGNAMCTYGGPYTGGSYQWKFEPSTPQWADFSDGFGTLKMPGLMSGFVGPYSTAMNNIGNFEIFFAMVGHLADKKKADWTCKGADAAEVQSEREDVDAGDRKDILRGMKVLN